MKVSDIHCERCGRGIPTPIFRLSPKGESFRGACRPCLTPEEWEKVSPEVKQIEHVLSGGKVK